jgi:hypothetical protein
MTRLADELEAFAEEAKLLNKKGDVAFVEQKKRMTQAIAKVHIHI